jgi:hypothetical protein
VIELWTCHLAHWGWEHALLNAVAAVPPLVVAPRRWRMMLFVLLAAPLVSLAVRAGFDGEYRGASGLVVAMWVYAGIAARNRLMLAAVAAKLAAEALGWMPAHEEYVTVALAHYAGATAGVVGGYFAGLDSSIEVTLIESPSASPLTTTS